MKSLKSLLISKKPSQGSSKAPYATKNLINTTQPFRARKPKKKAKSGSTAPGQIGLSILKATKLTGISLQRNSTGQVKGGGSTGKGLKKSNTVKKHKESIQSILRQASLKRPAPLTLTSPFRRENETRSALGMADKDRQMVLQISDKPMECRTEEILSEKAE